MESVSFWKVLRVLTTNACNYKCVFCHNEGQEKYDGQSNRTLKLKDFKFIVSALGEAGLSEIQFSGGEPFMNIETLPMILWANDHTSLELGCATNTQFFDDDIIRALARTRIKLNIQFPSLSERKFEAITKTTLYRPMLQNLVKLKDAGVDFSLNYVLLTPDTSDFEDILPFLIDQQISIKILPFVNKQTLKRNEFRKYMIPLLDGISHQYEDMNNGSLKWRVKISNDKDIIVKYIDSPCFGFEFDICKNYAEIRLLPDLTIQSCLIDTSGNLKLDFDLCEPNQARVQETFQTAWKNFTHC